MAIQIERSINRQSPIVGIDLGTTNSLVSVVRDGVPVILKGTDGSSLLPSVVSLIDGKAVVGREAKRHKIRDAAHTVFSAKRLLGRGLEDLEDVQSLPYRVVAGEGGIRIQVGDRAYSAVEISAMILRELKINAERALQTPVTRAVITVPAYFNDSQRQATRMAGRLAGLDVLRIVNEPTAAALAYGLDRKRQGLVAVYDLGGGTFDISILKLHDGIFEVLATNGDSALGGDDLDQAIASIMESEIERQFGIRARSDIQLHAAVLEAAESAKIRLSDAPEAATEVLLPGGSVYRHKWTAAEFSDLARPVLERTRQPCLNALKDAGLSPDQLSDVVLVGGPTRLRIVQEMVREIFGREPNSSVHPDEVVAAGAAIQADILAGNNKDFLLLDVVPLSLGIETYGGLMSALIPRNSRIPTVAREIFTTFVENQTAVDIHVLQGERERVDANRSLARFKLKGIEPSPAGFPRVEVTFLIDADGILQVAARDLKTGNEQSVEVRPSYGLSESEIEKMLLERIENVDQDGAFRKLVEVKNDAEIVLQATEKRLADARRLLPENEAHRIEESVQGLRIALSQADAARIHDAAAVLKQSTMRLAELLLKDVIQRRADDAVDKKPLGK